jgi:dissimilatory sulfite reductase (desulfoviridin) alpha/beta subunit
VVNAAEAVVKLFRDHGNRGDRKRARIKYVVHDWGVEKFRQVLAEYIGGALVLPKPVTVRDADQHLGWHPQGHGQFFYGLSIENGRVKDEGAFRLRSALRKLLTELKPSLRITANQDLLLCDLDESARGTIEKTLADHGVRRPEQVSRVKQLSMACPAIPTCGLAITESERALPTVIEQLEKELARLELADERLTVRMTGCPNGCARPYQSDIGIVGRSGEKYLIYVGGRLLGDRLSFPLRDLVPLNDIVPTLRPVLEQFKKDRQPSEGFGDYCTRLGTTELEKLLPPLPEKPSRLNHDEASQPTVNGGPHPHGTALASKPALTAPRTESVAMVLTPPETRPVPIPPPAKLSETFYAGQPREERADFTRRYASDGSVRDTVLYFYEEDSRAAGATPGAALRREAVYAGQVDPYRLHGARKLSDTFLVGPAGQELRDRRVDYIDGRPASITHYYYEGDRRASEAPSNAPLHRQVVEDVK